MASCHGFRAARRRIVSRHGCLASTGIHHPRQSRPPLTASGIGCPFGSPADCLACYPASTATVHLPHRNTPLLKAIDAGLSACSSARGLPAGSQTCVRTLGTDAPGLRAGSLCPASEETTRSSPFLPLTRWRHGSGP